MDVLLVGSIAYDSVTSPAGKVERALGGSATYGGLASSFHAKRLGAGTVGLVGVVGKDFTEGDRASLQATVRTSQGLKPLRVKHSDGKVRTKVRWLKPRPMRLT